MFAQISSALLAAIVAALIYSNILLWFVLAGNGRVGDAAAGAIVGSLLVAVIAFIIAIVISRNLARSRA